MERFARAVSRWASSSWAFGLAVMSVLIWAALGPLLHFSDGWQLTINTATTIVTFLMVFLIQSTQNRDAMAFHLKLDELIRSSKARNVFADLEDASEDELKAYQREFERLRQRRARGASAGHRL